ncbi:sel1 repeat family protein [Diaphorobacter ruginosibacter]|uniref:Sel1 repeat family protein n=1 Tax=Diaphorobacter ruginosibacter TaxID=1715720 RepID=A0A7G9RIM2_9BURK|nr:sel1 repeat family protein [Diaphorobacter ruginosibacter]QNN55447.1 sel1 repeat family protein [Diaphorobacter ruginosibacter]
MKYFLIVFLIFCAIAFTSTPKNQEESHNHSSKEENEQYPLNLNHSAPKITPTEDTPRRLSGIIDEKNSSLFEEIPNIQKQKLRAFGQFNIVDQANKNPFYAYRLWKVYEKCSQIAEANHRISYQEAQDILPTEDICKMYGNETGSPAAQFLYLAAKGGVPGAAVEYFNTFFMDFDAENSNPDKGLRHEDAIEGMEFLQSAALKGEKDAMLMLAGIYQTGMLVDVNLSEAYSYEYAAFRSGFFSNREKILEDLAEQLTENQLISAINQGESIFQKCCKK